MKLLFLPLLNASFVIIRYLSATKEALQKQLELVDRNRNLWMKSSQEVVRLKTMLQQAEETEKQLREQVCAHMFSR